MTREIPLEAGDLGPHLHPELGVEVGQRLVHEERGRLADDRPAHGHPLALAAGQLAGLAVRYGSSSRIAAAFRTRAVDLRSLGTRASLRANAMLSNTVMWGYSA